MKTSNYFQKVKSKNFTFLIIIAMLLTITNLNVYSSVGSYQTHSQAIDANEGYRKGIYLTRKYTNVPASVWADLVQNYVTDLPTYNAMPTEAYYFLFDDSTASSNYFLSLEKNYAKYDFSGFDN